VPTRPRDLAATARVTVAWKAYADVYKRRYSYESCSVALIFGGPEKVSVKVMQVVCYTNSSEHPSYSSNLQWLVGNRRYT
jgi:hypothetical protein